MTELHGDRRRAGSFGAAAAQYDDHRPRYPHALITQLVPTPGASVLDVGAGTGISSAQLAGAGAEVLAVEPDSQMAAVAAGKGLAVEVSTFEQWQPRGRTFDLVVFAQSFHWVEPTAALAKVAEIVRPGGRLALMWNRIESVTPARAEFDRAYAGIVDEWKRPSVAIEDTVTALLEAAGFDHRRLEVAEDLHYATRDWIDMVTTYSNVLVLDEPTRAELRERLRTLIGDAGVTARNDALAVVCTLRANGSGDQVSTA
jgi:SAM-dependent methyltransferase